MTAPVVSKVDAGERMVSRQVVVPAPAADVFALIANPHRHPELDGSGTLRQSPVSGPERLSEGAKFTVAMKQYGFPYKITSTVTAFADNQLIEWQHPMGHRWRWELSESEPGVTQVTETFDYSTAKAPKVLELMGLPSKNAVGITSTLQALASRFA
ncbi:SRPBCC family protein [Jatrophihabitans sp. DSM 45814]